MNQDKMFPLYDRIALDIAMRIAIGELKENSKIYGRSVMSSEYGVSPETIRRALKQLADKGIIEIKQNSGVIVISQQKANEYILQFKENENTRSLQKKLKSLLEEQEAIHLKIRETINDLIETNHRFPRNNPFQSYEVMVPEGSPVSGRTLSEINFWHETGATVIAIYRDDNSFVAPGPYSKLMEKDRIIFVGDLSAIATVEELFKGR